jgi:DNA modification methylase
VAGFIDEFGGEKNTTVFDPFGGVGTTGVVAISKGHRACLMDVNPLGILASRVKTTNFSQYELEAIKRIRYNWADVHNYCIQSDIPNETVKRYFDPTTLDALLKVRSMVLDLDAGIAQDVYLLALLSLIEQISTHHKNGNGVKKKRLLPSPLTFEELRDILLQRIDLFVSDIELSSFTQKCIVINHSNLVPYSLPYKVDLVLTSPPYANCFDYSKVYLTELWVGGFFKQKTDQNIFREQSVISHVHYRWKERNADFRSSTVEDIIIPTLKKQNLWSSNIPNMLSGYFSDLGKCLYNISQNLNSGATVGFVVGNSVYGGVPIATDIILAEIAENLGFKCFGIRIYRKVIASSQQMVLLNDEEKHYVRESLVLLKWE